MKSAGLKRKASQGLENSSAYRVPHKYRADDSDTDDTLSVSSKASSTQHHPIRKRQSIRRKNSSESKPSLPNKQSTMQGVVTAFLGLRSRTIIRETAIPEDEVDDDPPPLPRKMLSAKRKMYRKSSSTGDLQPTAAVATLQRRFSKTRAATALY